MDTDKENSQRHRKTKSTTGPDMRMGYHSEKANLPEAESDAGMRMGYHSEKANLPEAESDAGMRMGYHSEKANPSKHAKRLHKKS
jgi:hypothetical protein